MTIQNATSNKTLKRAYVCPSLEIYFSEEETLLDSVSFTGEGGGQTPTDDEKPGENPELSKQSLFTPNMFTDEDFEDY